MKDQSCPRGAECTRDHPPVNGWKFVAGAEAKAKAKAKGKGKNKPKELCPFYAKGECKWGDQCRKDHGDGTVAAVSDKGGPTPKVKAKAKAKAEVSESGN